MSFIGIVADKKCFNNIKQKIVKEEINLIHINLKSIENIKNIKFETIIVEDNLEKFKNKIEIIKKIFESSSYLMINTDFNPEYRTISKNEKLITYGLNQKAMVTVSSITDNNILIYWQKCIKNKNGEGIEIEERKVEKNTSKIYEILIIYILTRLYNKT